MDVRISNWAKRLGNWKDAALDAVPTQRGLCLILRRDDQKSCRVALTVEQAEELATFITERVLTYKRSNSKGE